MNASILRFSVLFFSKNLGKGPFPFSRAHRIKLSYSLLLLLLLNLSGCASPPWGEIVSEQQSSELGQHYLQLIEQNKTCSTGFDGELKVQFITGLETIAQAGFFQMLAPSYLQIVISNPFGQPVLALSTNGRFYQELNSANRTLKTVTLRSFSHRNDIPVSFMRAHWFAWLTGRPLSAGYRIRAIREDSEGRGFWVEVGDNSEAALPLEYLLIDPPHNQVIERTIVEQDGTAQATIAYSGWQSISGCEQPMNISVTGLSFGATADLEFSDLRQAVLQSKDFNLPYPQGYSRQFQP